VEVVAGGEGLHARDNLETKHAPRSALFATAPRLFVICDLQVHCKSHTNHLYDVCTCDPGWFRLAK
jgi:hypothetical protein